MDYAPYNMTKEELVEYTGKWKGKRFSDGRPRVSNDILERMKKVTITQAWTILKNEGYNWQFAGDFIATHPGQVLIGRALTASYLPRRPFIQKLIEKKGKEIGCIGEEINWPIDLLQKKDVYVADVFGKINEGAVVGDNLCTSIYAKTGNGVVFDGSVRDLEGIQEIPNFTSFIRGWHPSYAYPTIMLGGVNCPINIGGAIVMPGDVVLGKNNGVIFIPPHLAEKIVKTSEVISLRDIFGKQKLKEGKYTSGEIDQRWTDKMEKDFSHWLKEHEDELPVTKKEIKELLKERTW